MCAVALVEHLSIFTLRAKEYTSDKSNEAEQGSSIVLNKYNQSFPAGVAAVT